MTPVNDPKPLDEIPVDMPKIKEKIEISWQAVFSGFMYIFMYLPIIVLTFYSFNKSRYGAEWKGFSLEWYAKLFADVRILSALRYSLMVAVLAVGIAAIFGTLMAVGLSKYNFRGKS